MIEYARSPKQQRRDFEQAKLYCAEENKSRLSCKHCAEQKKVVELMADDLIAACEHGEQCGVRCHPVDPGDHCITRVVDHYTAKAREVGHKRLKLTRRK